MRYGTGVWRNGYQTFGAPKVCGTDHKNRSKLLRACDIQNMRHLDTCIIAYAGHLSVM